MVFGVDPVDIILVVFVGIGLLFVGMVGLMFMTVRLQKNSVILLEGIHNEARSTSGSLSAAPSFFAQSTGEYERLQLAGASQPATELDSAVDTVKVPRVQP